MKLREYIKQKKEFYQNIIEIIDNDDEDKNDGEIEKECNILCNKIKSNYMLGQNRDIQEEEMKIFLHLILNIANNHRRSLNLDTKINLFLNNFKADIKQILTNSEIFKFFKKNKRILLYLIQNEILIIDNEIIKLIREKKSYCYFFYPEIKMLLTNSEREKIEGKLDFTEFENKRQIGENDSFICSLIRQDLVDEFIVYVNKKNLSFSSTRIKQSIFETNSFLIDKKPTLIEYAAFFGSIQIFQYLRFNNVPLESSLWLYSIHSKNANLIHLLEENQVEPNDSSYEECFIESIKCHHNDIADYIIDCFLSNQKYGEKVTKNIIKKSNFKYFPDNFKENFSFYYLCKSEYKTLVDLYIDKIKYLIEPQIKSNNMLILLRNAAQNNKTDVLYYLLSKKDIIYEKCFEGCKQLNKVVIPPTIKTIESYAFKECESLSRVIIPLSVTRIESYAFCLCESLNKISIPSSVTFIGSSAFHACSFEELIIPPLVKTIDGWCYGNNHSLKKVFIPPSVCYIGHQACAYCRSLEDIIIPSSVKTIESCAFTGCSSFVNITIPPSITEINESVFDGCSSLVNVSIPSSVTLIKMFSFGQCASLKEIILPPSVTHIDNKAFFLSLGLEKISIPSSLNIDNVEINRNVEIIRY